ncbi:MAG TPA: hypothetical protein VKB19_18410 [Pedobacter sp.]|nr:hypothetical protein [Pedobacter sp.]
MPRGTKVERNFVSDQSHEINFEAGKMGVKSSKLMTLKKANPTSEKKLKRK